MEQVRNTAFWLLIVSSVLDRHVEKENLADFISKKREMFLVQVRFCSKILWKSQWSEVKWSEVSEKDKKKYNMYS